MPGAKQRFTPTKHDITLHQVGRFDFVDFSRVPDLIQRGREAAEAHVARIKADLKQAKPTVVKR